MIYFIREKRFCKISYFNSIVDSYIRKLFPFRFPQKINKIFFCVVSDFLEISLFSFRNLLRNLDFFISCHKATLICCDTAAILFLDRDMFIQSV